MYRTILTVLGKEWLDLVRDRRALIFLFAPPILMPLLGLLGGGFVMWQLMRHGREGFPIVVTGGEHAPTLVARLEEEPTLRLVDPPPALEPALQSGEVMAVLAIPSGVAVQVMAGDPVTLTLTSSRSGWLPAVATEAIDDAVAAYGEELLEQRLAAQGLDRSWLEPVRIERETVAAVGVAAPSTATGTAPIFNSLLMPLAIASWALSGGLGLVSHMTVGEKERRTMESLLLTPASRVGIVLGKIGLSILASAVVIGLWSVDGLAFLIAVDYLPASAMTGIPLAAQMRALGAAALWVILLVLPLMTTVNGLVAAACTFARNYRESNLFVGLLQLGLPGLAFLATFSVSASPPAVVYALPAVGALVAVRDLFQGGVPPEALALALVAGLGYAAGAILLAAYVFSREWALMRGV